MDSENSAQQGPPPAPMTLKERVISLIKEDLNIPYRAPIEVRQPPINDDDHDSWEMSNVQGAFDYLANQLIELIKGEK